MKTIILAGETFEFTPEQYEKLLEYATKEIRWEKLKLALAAREDDPRWKKQVETIKKEDRDKASEAFDHLVSDYTGEDEENAIEALYQSYTERR